MSSRPAALCCTDADANCLAGRKSPNAISGAAATLLPIGKIPKAGTPDWCVVLPTYSMIDLARQPNVGKNCRRPKARLRDECHRMNDGLVGLCLPANWGDHP